MYNKWTMSAMSLVSTSSRLLTFDRHSRWTLTLARATGMNVAINGEGTILAVGAHQYRAEELSPGYTRVFQLDRAKNFGFN